MVVLNGRGAAKRLVRGREAAAGAGAGAERELDRGSNETWPLGSGGVSCSPSAIRARDVCTKVGAGSAACRFSYHSSSSSSSSSSLEKPVQPWVTKKTT